MAKRRTNPPARPTDERLRGTGQLIEIGLIEPHPDNPRKTFEPAEIEALAGSLQQHGLLQPIVVREHGKGYQLVAGERRFRAAKQAGWDQVPAVVRELTDAAALELMLVENLDREGLNPLETAAGLVNLTKPLDAGGAGLTQAAAAERFGRSQSWAANLIRLLELPEPWRGRLISGEITESQGRSLLAYAGSPVLPHLDKVYRRDSGKTWSRDELLAELRCSLQETTRPMSDQAKHRDWVPGLGVVARRFEPTDAQREKLAVVELPVEDRETGKLEGRPVATNVNLWNKLQRQAMANAEKAGGKGKNGQSNGKSAKKKEPTAAELRKKAAERRTWLAERIKRWRNKFLRTGIITCLTPADRTWSAVQLLIYLAGSFDSAGSLRRYVRQAVGVKGHEHSLLPAESLTFCQAIDVIREEDVMDLARKVVIPLLAEEHDRWPKHGLSDEVVEWMAVEYGHAMPAAWEEAQEIKADKRLVQVWREFFGFHQVDELVALTEELGVPNVAAKTKAALIRHLTASAKHGCYLPLPKSIAAAAPKPKRKRK